VKRKLFIHFISIAFVSLFNSGCIPDSNKVLTSEQFLSALAKNSISFTGQPLDAKVLPVVGLSPSDNRNAFDSNGTSFLVIECTHSEYAKSIKSGNSEIVDVYYNENLALIIDKGKSVKLVECFLSLKPPLSYRQIGIFIYPLVACLVLAVFIITERLYSLRRGLTFPRKVEKALRSGEFPNKKWKRKSSAERISNVAIEQKPSQEALLAYSRLEIAALEKGLFLLEVVVAGAPLIGLLGTATGLVQVFSAMPANGLNNGTEIFSEGIAMALLTTIIGLAIAIPALIGHAYLCRVVDKRAASLDWLTARLIDAVGKNKTSHNFE
jgi:biopolymer transport protein ExbB